MRIRIVVAKMVAAIAVSLSFNAAAATYRVTGNIVTEGDGQSWASPMSITNAFAAAAAATDPTEIWVSGDVTISAAPTTVTVATNVLVRGGFAGTEDSPAGRIAGAVSKITGNDAYNLFVVSVNSGCTLTFERLFFTRAKTRAVQKSGNGNLTFTDSSLSQNGRTIGHNTALATGCGLYASGSGTLTVSNTLVEGNGPVDYDQNNYGGYGIYAENASRIYIDDCSFATNGIWLATKGNGWNAPHKGLALYVKNAPLTMRNTRFAGNISKPSGSNAGGTVYLEGACGGSALTNCVFIGNLDLLGYTAGDGGGICIVNLSSTDATVDVSGCTFAHNLTQSRIAAAGLVVTKGSVHVTDSVFYHNLLGYSAARGYGSDISVHASGKLSIEKSTVSSLVSSISTANADNLNVDTETMSTDDPKLTTSVLDSEALVSWGTTLAYTKDAATYTALAKFDATPLSPKPAKPDVGAGNVLYVKADATGSCDGSSWANAFTDLASALSVVSSAKNEIWVAGNLTATADASWALVENDLVVRGGFVGTETAASERVAGAKATVDGADSYDLVRISVKPDVSVTFENVVFTRAKTRAVNKRWIGDLKFANCDFLGNGRTQKASGRAIFMVGGQGVATLTVTNCTFGGQMYTSAAESTGSGAAIYLANYGRLVADGSLFVTNGMAKANQGTQAGGSYGSAVYGYNTPVTMRRTRFSGNCNAVKVANGDGGTVYLEGVIGGSAFTNCVFTGNYELRRDSNSNTRGGALVLNPSSATAAIDIESCTFAYNLSQAGASASALTVRTGDVTVHNSIFWKNLHGLTTVTGYGSDIDVAAGTLNISHSIMTGMDIAQIHDATGSAITLDSETVYTDNPSFVTSDEEFEAMFTESASNYLNPNSNWTYAKAASLDVHLLSPQGYFMNDGTTGPATNVFSAAIDKGDPTSVYSNEPTPNGGRVNLGAYGNTEEASQTPTGQPAVTLVATTEDGVTRPKAVVTMGLASGVDYQATVTVTCSTGGVVIATTTYTGVSTGTVLEWLVPEALAPGAAFTFSVSATAAGATAVSESETANTGTNTYPIWYGKGGGEGVLHVRAGANYRMDGTDWLNAFPDVSSAVAAMDSTTREIWIADGLAAQTLTIEPTVSLAIRGGFAGTETSAAERAEGTRTVFDYNHDLDGWTLTNGEDAPVEFDRLVFQHTTKRAIYKTGAGDFTFRDGSLDHNGQRDNVQNSKLFGRALYATGSSAATITIINSTILGNRSITYYQSESVINGASLTVESCKRLVVDDTLFASNGMHLIEYASLYPYYGGTRGSAIYADATPVTVRGCRFTANTLGGRHNSGAGVVVLLGNCGGSAFTNCVWVGNYDKKSNYPENPSYGGALTIGLDTTERTVDIKNCTFAYNVAVSANTAGGLNVVKGAVTVEDSIFFWNRRTYGASTTVGNDIHVTDGSCVLRDCSVTGTDTQWCTAAGGKTLDLDADGKTVYAFDPSFVSGTNAFLNLYTVSATDPMVSIKSTTSYADLAAPDVHLLSSAGYFLNDGTKGPKTRIVSPAIDVGNKNADYSREPEPNGQRVNLGAYGNTPYASMSPLKGTLIFLK